MSESRKKTVSKSVLNLKQLARLFFLHDALQQLQDIGCGLPRCATLQLLQTIPSACNQNSIRIKEISDKNGSGKA
jgi:hypothetical protein